MERHFLTLRANRAIKNGGFVCVIVVGIRLDIDHACSCRECEKQNSDVADQA